MIVGMRLQSSLEFDGYIKKKEKTPENAVTQAVKHVRSKYYGDYDAEYVTDKVLNTYLGSLDKHSRYFLKSQHTQYRNFLSGKYEGLGFEFMTGDSSLYVSKVLSKSPAEESGFTPGDEVVAIRGTEISGDYLSLDSIQILCDSELGDTIAFEIRRFGSDKTTMLDVIAGSVKIPVVRTIPIKDHDIIYVDIERFTNDVYKDFMESTEEYLQGDEKDLIIDVRGNPGGTLEETIKIINQFVRDAEVRLLSTVYRNDRKRHFESTGRTFLSVDDMVVLIDDESASSSEIVAGVLQDLDRAKIIGLPSYGKGSIQQNYMLSNGGSLQLTIGAYVLPGGRVIGSREDSLNIWPDIEISEMQCLDSIPGYFVAARAEDLIVSNLDLFTMSDDKKSKINGFQASIEAMVNELGLSPSCEAYLLQELNFEIWKKTAKNKESIDLELVDAVLSEAIDQLK